jgi:hypothetical protein
MERMLLQPDEVCYVVVRAAADLRTELALLVAEAALVANIRSSH